MDPLRLFISYSDAKQDISLADELLKHASGLEQQGFIGWHRGFVLAGKDRQQEIATQIGQAHLIVVLLSSDFLSHGNKYREEFDEAVRRHRQEEAYILPVLLRKVTLKGSPLDGVECLPKNGKPVKTWGDRDDAWVQVVEEIRLAGERIRRKMASAPSPSVSSPAPVLSPSVSAAPAPSPAAPSPASVPPPPPTDPRYTGSAGTAINLDRRAQWGLLLDRCREPQHTFFLLFGPRHQYLDRFIERVWRYLNEERSDPHLVLTIPFEKAGQHALSGTDLQRHLRQELFEGLGGGPDLEGALVSDLIGRATEEQPLFLFLGRRPIDALPEAKQAALRDFLCQRLPALLPHARQPVRVLLALDYLDKVNRLLVDQVQEWAQQAESAGLRFCRLQEVSLPPWAEVEEFLWNYHPRPARQVINAIEQEYLRLTRGGSDVSFLDLAAQLDRFLQEA